MFLRPFLGVALIAAIGLVPLAPTEHVHEIEEHGHLEFVVHRHVQAHALEHATHHDDGRTIDHQDPPIATLDQDYIVPGVARLGLPSSTFASTLREPTISRRIGFTGFVERLIHGPPPGPIVQRGPPSPLSC